MIDKKVVTDPVLLSALSKQDMDSDSVEFIQDYAPRALGKEHSPYAKFYRDLKSNKRFMVVSGLPMVRPDGKKIEVGWIKRENRYISKANLFSAIIKGRQVKVTCLFNQPNGTKKSEQVTWQPQLFLNGREIKGRKAILLDSDSTNENYHQNILEWDYGICKRRIRIIEGRIREKWVFNSNPKGEVKIKHNVSGNCPMRYGRGQDAEANTITVEVAGDEEIVKVDEFYKAVFPVEIGASPETFYPDADPESTSVDGYTITSGVNFTWATFRAKAGMIAVDDIADGIKAAWRDDINNTDRFGELYRSLALFDSSPLPSCIITAGVLSFYGYAKGDPNSNAPSWCIYTSNPNTNTALIPADHGTIGAIAHSNAIAYADANVAGYNDFTLLDVDTDGFGYIEKNGITKLGIREAIYDAAGAVPTWGAGGNYTYLNMYAAEQGAGFKPKLVVTYTIGVGRSHGYVFG